MDTVLVKISICIPVYNVAAYLAPCLESVVAAVSNYCGPVQCEILVVNDASTDDSLSVLDAFSRSHPEIVIRSHEKNKGLAEARNTLLSMASGDYIAWVDSDDLVSGDWFSELAKILEQDRPDVIAFELRSLYDDGRSEESNFGEKSFDLRRDESRVVSSTEYACKVLQGLTILDYSHTRIVRRELHDGIFYRAPRGVWEDTIFAFDFLPRVQSVRYIAKPLYAYRQRGDSIMHTRKTENWLHEIEVMRETIEKMESPYREAATVHMMSAMRRVMVLAAKDPSNAVLQVKASEFRQFLRQHIVLVLTEPYLSLKRRVADLLTMLPFSNFLLRRCAG